MPETEAEALLRSGALYPRRVGLRPDDGGPLIFAGLKHGAFSLYCGDEPSYHFDLEGRWQRCYVHPSHHLRRLDGSTQAIDRPRHGRNMVLDRRTLDRDEADALDASIRSMAIDLADRLDSGAVTPVPPPPPSRAIDPEELRSILGRIARWDADAWDEHRRRYRETYGPFPFLPPDSLDALVLQATARRPDVGIVARTPEEFEAHCRDVAALLGRGVVPYRALFLDGPDALRRPGNEVEAYLRTAIAVFPMADTPAPARRSDLPINKPHREGIHAFVGPGDGPIPPAESWPRFRSLGLIRVTVGVSTATDPPPHDAITPRDEVASLVAIARGAGLAISVVTWIEPGDTEPPEATAARIRSLGLGSGDHVYLVDAGERPGAPPSPSSDQQSQASEAALREAMAGLRGESGVKVLPYSVRKQGI